jgi:hypothetical protein
MGSPRPGRRARRALTLRVAACVALAAAAGGTPERPAAAGAAAGEPGVVLLVTVDKHTWQPYEYGSAFFFDGSGDAYTASHVVADAVRDTNVMLVAIVNHAEYAARVACWNPAMLGAPGAVGRDVAIVHVGPEVPLFPLWEFAPATSAPAAVPLRIQTSSTPPRARSVRVVGFGGRAGRSPIQVEREGRVTGTARAPDGATILTMSFPAAAAPVNGDSGAPVLDGGVVVGLVAWERTRAVTTEVDAVAASSFGCVAHVPAGQNPLRPIDAPVRRP